MQIDNLELTAEVGALQDALLPVLAAKVPRNTQPYLPLFPDSADTVTNLALFGI